MKRMETQTQFFTLRKMREAKLGRKLPLATIAKDVDVNIETLRGYEKGRIRRFDAVVVDKLMNYFEVSNYDDFFIRVEVDDETKTGG